MVHCFRQVQTTLFNVTPQRGFQRFVRSISPSSCIVYIFPHHNIHPLMLLSHTRQYASVHPMHSLSLSASSPFSKTVSSLASNYFSKLIVTCSFFSTSSSNSNHPKSLHKILFTLPRHENPQNSFRSFSSSSAEEKGAQFVLSSDDALTKLIKFNRNASGLLAPSLTGNSITSTKKIYVPMYLFDYSLHIEYTAVELSKKRVTKINPQTNQSQTENVIEEVEHRRNMGIISKTKNDPDSQLSATFSIPDHYINQIKTISNLHNIKPLKNLDTKDVTLLKPDFPEDRAVQMMQFNLQQVITKLVHQDAHNHFSKMVISNIKNVDVNSNLTEVELVYVPVYEFRTNNWLAYVNALDGHVAAVKQYSAFKAIVFTALASVSWNAVLGHVQSVPDLIQVLYDSSLAFMLIAGLAARYVPRFRAKWIQSAHRQQVLLHEAEEFFGNVNNDSSGSSAEQDAYWQRFNRQRDYQKYSYYRQADRNVNFAVAMGSNYYHELGLEGKEATATMDEIKEAYRDLAKKHHPDMQTESTKKKEAAAKFQKITEAYQVLRDPEKRKQYDRHMMYM